jgi:hypothetical protein
MADVCYQAYITNYIINLFDSIDEDEYQKDFNLITTATAIARGAIVLDLIYRTYEKK